MKKNKWLKPIKKAKKLKIIKARKGAWKSDPKGFFLIKLNYKDKTIHVGYCTNKSILKYEIVGKKAQDIYHTIANMKLISLLEHASYLGEELKEAEFALKYNLKYVQDKDIDFKDKIK